MPMDREAEPSDPGAPGIIGALRGLSRSVWLGVAIAVVAGSMVALLGYVLYAGLLSPQPPRTAEERQITVLEKMVESKPKDQAVWADYAKTLIDAKQYSKAERAIADARALLKQAPEVDLQEARMFFVRGERDAALAALDRIVAGVNSRRKAQIEALAAKGVAGVVTRLDSETLVNALVLKAAILGAKEDIAGQIESLTLALTETPSMADVLVIRGGLYAKTGESGPAEKDYRAALSYVPGYAPALDGLRRLGKDASK